MKTIIFDLDGTLVDSLPGIAASLNRTLIGHGLPGHRHENVRRFIGDGARKLAERALSEVRRPDLIDSVLAGFAKDYAISWQDGTTPYAGVTDLLQQLKVNGHTLCVLSNKPHPFTTEIVSRLFAENTFRAVRGHAEPFPLKPDPTSTLAILSEFHEKPENCLFIGDSTMDLETAKNAGIPSIAVTWGYHDAEKLTAADHITHRIEELAEALRH